MVNISNGYINWDLCAFGSFLSFEAAQVSCGNDRCVILPCSLEFSASKQVTQQTIATIRHNLRIFKPYISATRLIFHKINFFKIKSLSRCYILYNIAH